VHTEYLNCLTKIAIQTNPVIACIVLSTDNYSHFVFFCFRTSQIASRSPANVKSLGKFLSVSGPVVREGLDSRHKGSMAYYGIVWYSRHIMA